MQRIYLIAGEASGDLHGSALIKALKRQQSDIVLQGWGGDEMAEAGCTVVKHYRDLAFMGFVEVIRNLGKIRKNFAFAKKDIAAFNPDIVVFIDYPGFNMRLLPWVKKQGIKVVYYIAPQVWAWHQSRVKTLRRYVDELLVILPFEEAFFEEHDVRSTFIGHPLATRIQHYAKDPNFYEKHLLDPKRPIVALLPGSRKQEIKGLLPIMLTLEATHPQYQWVIAAAPSLPESFYRSLVPPRSKVALIQGDTYGLLCHAKAAIVTSGTATLETALFEVPQVVVYKGNPLSFAIAKRLIKVKYISLVNLLLNRPLVQELIQHDLQPMRLAEAFDQIMQEDHRAQIMHGYRELIKALAGEDASEKAAKIILKASN